MKPIHRPGSLILSLLLAPLLALSACSSGDSSEISPTPTVAPTPTAVPTVPPVDPNEVQEVAAGEVSGSWSGAVKVLGSVKVPSGQNLTLAAGTTVLFAADALLEIQGTMSIQGESGQKVYLTSESGAWSGMKVTGALDANFVEISNGRLCVDGLVGSTVAMRDSLVRACQQTVRFANGATLLRSQFLGGGNVYVTGGALKMEDSTIDLQHPEKSPDCLDITVASVDISYSRLTGCHCPIHFNESVGQVNISHSVLDGAAIPIMIAKTTGTFVSNNIEYTQTQILDIGGGTGEIQANIAGNYWGGAAPTINSPDESQFIGADQFLTSPVADAGPR